MKPTYSELLDMLRSLSPVFNDPRFTDRGGYGGQIDALIARAEGAPHVHDWESSGDTFGLIDRCRVCGEERA